MANDFYTPERLALLRDQIAQAVATGRPWMAEGARQAWDYARQNGADLSFDATGTDTPPAAGADAPAALPAVSESVSANDAAVQAAIGQASTDGVYQPPAPATPTVPSLAAPPGGGSTQTPANAPPSLAEDPAYQAFQRALGLERSTAERNTNDQVDTVNRGVAMRLPQLAEAGAVSRERLSGGYESRGLLRSGQHETALARQRQGEANATAGVQSDAANRVAALRQALAQSETGFDTRSAEAALGASQRQQDQTNAQQLQSNYQDQLARQIASENANQQRSLDAQNQLLARYASPGSAPPASSGARAANGVGGVQYATDANPIGMTGAGGNLTPDYLRLVAGQIGIGL